jgi:hypothetical protein
VLVHCGDVQARILIRWNLTLLGDSARPNDADLEVGISPNSRKILKFGKDGLAYVLHDQIPI